jgi:hypothetical protein
MVFRAHFLEVYRKSALPDATPPASGSPHGQKGGRFSFRVLRGLARMALGYERSSPVNSFDFVNVDMIRLVTLAIIAERRRTRK